MGAKRERHARSRASGIAIGVLLVAFAARAERAERDSAECVAGTHNPSGCTFTQAPKGRDGRSRLISESVSAQPIPEARPARALQRAQRASEWSGALGNKEIWTGQESDSPQRDAASGDSPAERAAERGIRSRDASSGSARELAQSGLVYQAKTKEADEPSLFSLVSVVSRLAEQRESQAASRTEFSAGRGFAGDAGARFFRPRADGLDRGATPRRQPAALASIGSAVAGRFFGAPPGRGMWTGPANCKPGGPANTAPPPAADRPDTGRPPVTGPPGARTAPPAAIGGANGANAGSSFSVIAATQQVVQQQSQVAQTQFASLANRVGQAYTAGAGGGVFGRIGQVAGAAQAALVGSIGAIGATYNAGRMQFPAGAGLQASVSASGDFGLTPVGGAGVAGGSTAVTLANRSGQAQTANVTSGSLAGATGIPIGQSFVFAGNISLTGQDSRGNAFQARLVNAGFNDAGQRLVKFAELNAPGSGNAQDAAGINGGAPVSAAANAGAGGARGVAVGKANEALTRANQALGSLNEAIRNAGGEGAAPQELTDQKRVIEEGIAALSKQIQGTTATEAEITSATGELDRQTEAAKEVPRNNTE